MSDYQDYRVQQIKEITSNLNDHFEALSDHALVALDEGVTVHYNMGNGEVVVIAGWPHDSARNGSQEFHREYGWYHVKCQSGGLFVSTPQEQLEWLHDQSEIWAEDFMYLFEADIESEEQD